MRSVARLGLGALLTMVSCSPTVEPVRPGERVVRRASAPTPNSVLLHLPAGAWEILVESTEFDVLAAIGERAELEEYDEGPGFGERLTLEVETETRVVVRVGGATAEGQEFSVAVSALDPSATTPPAREVAALVQYADRAGTRGPKLLPALVRAIRKSVAWRDLDAAREGLRALDGLVTTPAEELSARVLRAAFRLVVEMDTAPSVEVLTAALDRLEDLAWGTDFTALLALGEVALQAKDLDGALDLFERAAARSGTTTENARALLGEARALAAASRSDALGPDAEEVTAAYDRAVAFLEVHEDPSDPSASAAVVRYAVGMHHWERGDWERSRAVAQGATRVGIPPHLRLRLLALLCDLDVREHRFLAAEERIDAIVSLLAEEGFPPEEVGRVEDLGFSCFLLGRYAESARLVDRVLEVTEGVGGIVRAEAWITRSALLEVEEDLEGAEAAALESLATLDRISRAKLADVAFNRAANRVNIGRFRRKLGRVAEAEEDFRAALAIAEDHGFGQIGIAASHGLAEVLLELGRPEDALERMAPIVSRYRALGNRDALLAALETLGRVELALGDLARVRAVLDDADRTLADAGALDAWGAAGVRSRYADFARLAQDWVAHRLAAADSEDARAAIVADGFARAGQWKARALLARLQAQAGQPVADAASPRARIAALLGQGRVLVEYAAGRDRLYAYRLSSSGLEFFDLGDRAPVEAALRDYRDRVLVSAEVRDAASVISRAHDLHETLLAPLLGSDLPEHLVVVPEGILGTVPFETFVVRHQPEGEAVGFENADFVIDRCRVTYAPSSPVLAEQMSRDPRPLSSGRGLLLGDAIFPLEDGDLDGEFRGLMRLDKTRAECVFVADLMLHELPDDDARRGALGVRMLDRPRSHRPLSDARFDLFLGAEARPSRVLESSISDYTILHLATHGHVDRTDPTRSGLVLSADDDGARVLDVARIRGLRELDALVVLSACETAGGPVLRGEGVQSIGSAFLEGGARGVVGSLWPVGDSLARELMQPFYRGVLLDGRSASAALDDARRALRRRRGVYRGLRATGPGTADLLYAHPSVWAPFVYWGRVAPR